MSVTGSSDEVDAAVARPRYRLGRLGQIARATDSYGLVMVLILLDYVALSALGSALWSQLVIVWLTAATLLITLHTSHVHRRLMLVGVLFLLAATLVTVVVADQPQSARLHSLIPLMSSLMLLIALTVIVRRIATHPVVTAQTVLGAVDVYLLFGMIFAHLYAALAGLGSTPFFTGVSPTTFNDCLFFSYTTLSTVGYGNLVPAGSFGQTLAMLEALLGQIYLVLLVSRLVSLWGQASPRFSRRPSDPTTS
jgi:hypothetical protein